MGRRVSVRRVLSHTADGRPHYGDVVGDLVGLDARTVVIDTRRGPVEIDRASITIASPAPPSTRDELALQAVAASGWRAEQTDSLGGWLLRASGGFGGRGNSVLPLSAPGRPLDNALAQAGAWYAERALPLRMTIPKEARRLLDAELSERGWLTDYAVHTMARRLDAGALEPPSPGVRLDTAPDDAWFSRYRNGLGANPAAQGLLTRHDRVTFASIRDGAGVLAIGRASIDDGWLGVTAVEVAPDARRAGLARAVMAALHRWGAERGATRCYLQLTTTNEPALTLYRSLGYWVHHDHHYRMPPGARPLP